MLGYDILNAFDASDGITFDDVLGVFAGKLPPNIVDTGNMPNGSLYLQYPKGVYQKQNYIWVRLDTLLGSDVNTSFNTTDGLTVEVVHGVIANISPTTAVQPLPIQRIAQLTDERTSDSYKSKGKKRHWNTVALTSTNDPFGLITLVKDDFVLQQGMYKIDGFVVGSGRLRLYNETTSATLIVGPPANNNMLLRGFFEVATGDLLEVQYYPSSDEGDYKQDSDSKDRGTNELYALLEVQHVS